MRILASVLRAVSKGVAIVAAKYVGLIIYGVIVRRCKAVYPGSDRAVAIVARWSAAGTARGVIVLLKGNVVPVVHKVAQDVESRPVN